MRSLPEHLLRELVRSPLAGAVLLVTFPLWYELGRRHDQVQTSATLAVVGGAALFGIAFDEPAQATLNACAVRRTARRWARTVLVAAVLAVSWVVVVVVTSVLGADLGSVSDRLPEAAAAAALASAFAAIGLRAGVRTPGLTAAISTVATMTISTAASFWWEELHWLPRLADPSRGARWWLTAALGVAVACCYARDPATPPAGARLARRRRAPARPGAVPIGDGGRSVTDRLPASCHPRSASRSSVGKPGRSAP